MFGYCDLILNFALSAGRARVGLLRIPTLYSAPMLDGLWQDLQHALRHLRRSPGFAAAALLTFAFGIGANTGIFTVLNALALRPIAIPEPDRLVGVTGRGPRGELRLTPIPAVGALARAGAPLDAVCGYNGGLVTGVESGGAATQTVVAFVTGRCFDAFGVPPLLGRLIDEDDASLTERGQPVAVLSHRLWTHLFGADPGAIGRALRIEGVELTVIGVLPPGFQGLQTDFGIDLFAPFDTVFPARTDRRPGAAQVFGRLPRGTSFDAAAAELRARWPAMLDEAVPGTLAPAERTDLRTVQPHVERLGRGVSTLRDLYAPRLVLVAWLTGLLFVVACVNLGGLLLARLAARGPELAMRASLGASRGRLARLLLLEGGVLAVGGAALALPASLMVVGPVSAFLPVGLVERTMTFDVDARVLAMTAGAGVMGALTMCVVPAWLALRQPLTLHAGTRRTIARSTTRWGQALLALQVAAALVLVVGAGLLVQSLVRLQRLDPGVRTTGILAVRVMSQPNGYAGIDKASYYPELVRRVRELSGVRSAGLARLFPWLIIDLPGQPIGFVGEPPGEVRATLETVSPGFFETVGVSLVAGRLPGWDDRADRPSVAVVNQRLARLLAADGNVIGRRVRFGADPLHADVTIVGIVANATLGVPRQPAPPIFYRPTLQAGRLANAPSLVVAVDGDTGAVAAGIRRIVAEGGREYVHEISPLADVFARAPGNERMGAALSATLAALALVLTCMGLYSVLAYAVARRTRELGVRMAVGATPASILRMVVQEGVSVTAAGLLLGVPAALGTMRLLRAWLFGISETDVTTFALAALVFLVVGVTAGLQPAWRAARVDPVHALRVE